MQLRALTKRYGKAVAVDGIDLTIDGVDEFDPELRLIKGGGAALLREKIIADASARMAVITDKSKALGETRGISTIGTLACQAIKGTITVLVKVWPPIAPRLIPATPKVATSIATREKR